MHRIAAAVLLSGCATYASYTKSDGEEPKNKTMAVLFAVESVAGAATAVGFVIRYRHEREWYENAAIGFLVPFIFDVAVALGVGTSDFAGE